MTGLILKQRKFSLAARHFTLFFGGNDHAAVRLQALYEFLIGFVALARHHRLRLTLARSLQTFSRHALCY